MPTPSQTAARALGRCWGAIFFSVFGAAWLLLASYAFAHFSKLLLCLILAAAAAFVIAALRLQRRAKEPAKNAYPEELLRRNGRAFGIVNAVTWIAVFLAFQIFGRLSRTDLSFPAVAFIVGLHFFPMPQLYRHRANLVTGVCLMALALLCPLLFHGDRMIGFVALGAGITLWISAAWALRTANRLLN